MSDDRRAIKSWAHRLSAPDEPLSLAEAHLLATIAGTDRLLECLTALQDMQMRLCRLESYLAARAPDYDHVARRAALGGQRGDDVE